MKIGQKHYILIIFSILSPLVVLFSYIFMYKIINNQAEATNTAYSELEYQDNIRKNEDELIKLYNSSEKQRYEVENLIISEDKIVDFIEYVEGIGKSSGSEIDISSINKNQIKKDSKEKDNFGSNISARVLVKGSWSSVVKTLYLIENMPYQIFLNNISITNDSSGDIGNGGISLPSKLASLSKKWTMILDIKVLSDK